MVLSTPPAAPNPIQFMGKPQPAEAASVVGDQTPAIGLDPPAEEAGVSPPLQLGSQRNLAELLERGPIPVPWAVAGLIAEHDISIVSGMGGIGKSYVLMELAIALCSGRPLFNRFPIIRPYNILYLDLEMAEWETDRRFVRMLLGSKFTPATAPANLKVFSKGTLVLDKMGHLEQVKHYVGEHHIDFILIDSVRRVIGGSENDSETTNQLLRVTKDIRDNLGCGFIFLGHWRKPKEDPDMNDPRDMLRGSSDWRNMADCHIAIQPSSIPDHLTIFPDKSRHEDVLDRFTVKFDHDDRDAEDGPFRMLFVEDAHGEELKNKILAKLTLSAGLTKKELCEYLSATPKQMRNALDSLLASTAIHRDHGRAGRAASKYFAGPSGPRAN